MVSRRGWFFGILAVKSAFGVAAWSRSRFSISRSVSSMAVGARGRVWVSPLSRFGGLVSCFGLVRNFPA